jgi:hypothetical protein
VTASYYDGRNFIYLIWKNYPSSCCGNTWRLIVRAQLNISREALRHWRGAAARARLRGQLAGLVAIPRLLRKRRQVMASRRVPDDYLLSVLTPVDETP